MKCLLVVPVLLVSCSALKCYEGFQVFGHSARAEEAKIKSCADDDCCGVVWRWYGATYSCFADLDGVCPTELNDEYCIGAWNGHGFDGKMEGPHWCACRGPVGHCMPDFINKELEKGILL
ncbi:hypothetical protein PFISCL1PPCAC_27635 [Pristionchus fissidentatus]|uniref:Uncharacterized protein n=1 Tax=Pristionchus fissidentatus TaxID=1538716 RepID=A0AAV5WZY2_9BILA|nr:hypothetical protein PFISCL1PPCAC_27635 [Pristionchus fissidentatus]